MDAIDQGVLSRSPPTRGLLALGVVLVTGCAVVGGLIVSGGHPLAAIAPSIAVLLLWTVASLPLRWTATVLIFLLLALDVSTDAEGFWASPLVHIGDLLGYGFAVSTGLPFAGFELVALYLMIVASLRRSTRPDVDGSYAHQTAYVLRICIFIALGGCLFAIGVSVLNGYGVALWKARYLLHGLMFFALFQTAFRRPSDFVPVGVAVVAAAHVKALFAVYVQLVAAPSLTGGRLACATNHGDSILFALAVLIVSVPFMVRWSRRALIRAILFLPLPLWGMLLNGRRLVWAILAMSMVVIFLSTSWRPWKLRIVKAIVLAAPLVLGYVGIGWSNASAGGVFTPIAKIRTMLDSKVDHSTLWREREAWNIARTIQNSSPLGIGLGGEYTEYMFNDDISGIYADYRGWPHNTVIGLLLLAGVPGFAALWLPYLMTVYLAIRSERTAKDPADRMAAILCIGSVVACLAVAWGDTGAHFLQYKLAIGVAMALAGKLAVSTGAWPKRESHA